VFTIFLFGAQEDDGESFQVTMVEPVSAGIRTGNLKVLPNRKIKKPVGHYGVAPLVETQRVIKNPCE
jgi:hypothetical protein